MPAQRRVFFCPSVSQVNRRLPATGRQLYGRHAAGRIQSHHAEYLAMQQQIEDSEDASDYRKIRAAIDRGEEELLLADMVDRLMEEHPVRVWREYRCLSQKALADKSGVTPSLLNQIENRKKQGSLDTLKKLAGALGVDLDDLT
ncbi:hypothetical protein CI610_00344 [invertebrate metagenome]|uniref:HTH cro/C1-type domain-containing protein n=1 Tax=invertebrate metagenome TaxID=1711999 RepID=A0A2H9TBV5_9ZZZZ